jgi:hypothetical protein
VSVKEMFAAFVLDRIVDVPELGLNEDRVAWAQERLGRVGAPLRMTNPRSGTGLDGLPDLATEWLDSPAVVRVIDAEEYRALVLVVSRSTVYGNVVHAGEAYPLHAAGQFRDLCDATDPTYAFVQTAPVDVIPDFLENVSAELLGLRLARLATFGFPLWYVNQAWARDLPANAGVTLDGQLPARHGVLVLDRDSLATWL